MPTASWLRRTAASLLLAVVAGAQVPSPVEFLGHEVGADERLCNFTDLMRYFRAVAAASDRVRLVDIGRTSYGQSMTMAIITSPTNQARLEQIRATAVRLCHARDADPKVAAQLAEDGRAVVWVDAGLHATEAIAGQNIIELVWQMASRDDAEVRRILDEARARAHELVRRNRDVMQEMAGALIEVETLDGERLERFLSRVTPVPSMVDASQVGRA